MSKPNGQKWVNLTRCGAALKMTNTLHTHTHSHTPPLLFYEYTTSKRKSENVYVSEWVTMNIQVEVGVFVWSCLPPSMRVHHLWCLCEFWCVRVCIRVCVSQRCDHGHSGMNHIAVVVVVGERAGSNNRFQQSSQMQNICRVHCYLYCT